MNHSKNGVGHKSVSGPALAVCVLAVRHPGYATFACLEANICPCSVYNSMMLHSVHERYYNIKIHTYTIKATRIYIHPHTHVDVTSRLAGYVQIRKYSWRPILPWHRLTLLHTVLKNPQCSCICLYYTGYLP